MKPLTHQTLKAAIVLALAVLPCLVVHAADSKRKNPTSKLYVSDVEGIASINTGEKIEDVSKKNVYAAEGVVLETKPDSKNSIVLSNGTGVSFDPDTRLELRRFLQEPFSPNRTDLEVEPSVSQTSAFLAKGSIGLCNSKFVAGSTMTYSTRHGTVSIRGRKVVIEASDTQTIVSMIEGESTVRGDLTTGGLALKSGQEAVITRNSSLEPPTIEVRPITPERMSVIGDKVATACMARKTVYFEVAERANQDASDGIFSQEDASGEEVIVPVEVLPGTIPPNITISPFKITQPAAP